MGKSLAAHALGCAVVAFAFVLGVQAPLLAQETAATPTVMYPDTSAVSRPLWAAPKSEAVLSPDENPNEKPLHPLPQRHSPNAQPNASDRALQTQAGARLNVQPKTGFDGIAQDGSIPPDPNIAVGPNHIVQLVNSEIAIYSKDGAILSGYPKKLSSLWASIGGGCSSKNAGDPVVQYDAQADRWVITQLGSLRSPYSECFAISTTPDPTGTYHQYSYNFGTTLNDYPKFGVWSTATNSAYLGTYNLFANGSHFAGSDLCAYDRAAMLAGAPSPASVCFTISNDGGFLPSDVDGPTAPSDGSPGYFLTFEDTSHLRLYKVTPDFATPANSTLSSPTDLGVASFQEACGGGACIPQPGTGRQLDSLGDRLMYRLAYRNFGDHESMVVNHSVVAGSSVGVRWYELRATTSGAFGVAQQGTFAPDSDYRWMGSIAMDQAGNMALGYSRSSDSTYPGIYLTGRAPGDPVGTMQAETTLQAGGGSQTGYTRWGDYTSMRIDPSDDCTFWYTNEYYPVTASYNWHTAIASFKFPGCGGTAANPDFSLAESPSPIAITAGSSLSNAGTVTVTAINGFASPVNLAASCPTGVSASLTPASVTPSANAALQVSAAADAASGPYICTITGTDSADPTLHHSTTLEVDVAAAASTSDFSISATNPALTISRGQTGSDTINLSLVSGTSDTVSLSVSGLPPRTSASFSPNPVPTPGSSTLTIKVNRPAQSGTSTLTVTGTDGTNTHSATIQLTIQ